MNLYMLLVGVAAGGARQVMSGALAALISLPFGPSQLALSPARQSTYLAAANANEISLFDSQGSAVAYISPDNELTIYLWSGEPVAYLRAGRSDTYSIFGFNGKHLGWLKNGIIRDHDGDAPGFVEGAVTGVLPQLQPLKGLKQLKPLRSLRELEPIQPIWSLQWSRVPLGVFLAAGTS